MYKNGINIKRFNYKKCVVHQNQISRMRKRSITRRNIYDK